MVLMSACSSLRWSKTELWEEADRYLSPAFMAAMTHQSWTEASEIEATSFLTFYLAAAYENRLGFSLPETTVWTEGEEPLIPAESVEESVLQFFDVNLEHLHTSPYYNADTSTYTSYGLGGAGNYKITNVTLKKSVMQIDFELYQDDSLLQSGTLSLQRKGEQFRYQSCTSVPV